MSYEAFGTPPSPEPMFCPLCDSESHLEGCELGELQKRVVNAELTVGEQQRQLEAHDEQLRIARDALDKSVRALVKASCHVDNDDFVNVMMARDAANEALAALSNQDGNKLLAERDSRVAEACAKAISGCQGEWLAKQWLRAGKWKGHL